SDLGKALTRSSRRTYLKPGDPYDLDVIKRERERIDGRLKERGFYFFSPEDIIVQVDSTNNTHKVDMLVNIKGNTADKAEQVYKINIVYIYPNLDMAKDSVSIGDA